MLVDLTEKRVSASELLDAHVARQEALHGRLNAVIATDMERARRDAKAIDEKRAKGAAVGPLAGIPMTIKDVFDVEGMPAVVGNSALANRPKTCRDADMVAAARTAGAVIWGKTNVPLMAGDMQTYNDVYGTTNNPYDTSRTTGGSSGGAAAALAAGITPLEIGSDIGGSLRHPANFCGVFSLKPTWNLLSQRGHVPPLPENFVAETDLNVVGPMARNAEDLKLLFGVLRGAPAAARKDIRGSRIALWDEEPGFPLAAEVRAKLHGAAKALEEQGAKVERAKPAISGEALMAPYITLLAAIIAAGFPEPLYRMMASTHEADMKALAGGASPYSMEGYRAASSASFREVSAAQAQRQKMKDTLAQFFDEGWSAILMPLGPVAAFTHRHQGTLIERTLEVDNAVTPYLTLLNWIALATALHAPALAAPAGRTAGGLPVGVQLVGPWNSEDRLFDFALALEETFAFQPPAL